ncbi:MAG TPA: ATP-binding protein [Tepidisphaeraceae bacterium]|jgi:hypothetical protein|nr:ATP-binding protein [Tepidisphaeraceae bacterium]
MSHTDLNLISPDTRADSPPIPVIAPLPPAVVWTAHASSSLRAYLHSNNLQDYKIFHSPNLNLHDIDDHLPDLDPAAAWELPSSFGSTSSLSHDSTPRLLPAGFLHLPHHRVVLARWHWISDEYPVPRQLLLIAAPDAGAFDQLRQQNLHLRRQRTASSWTILTGIENTSSPTRTSSPNLILSPSLRLRFESEILNFFDDSVANLYRSLAVPYRRGLLLHGPPGNGKTSLIRWIGSSLPNIPALVLRPHAAFDSDDLSETISQWTQLAPSLLVIEDLDWLLARVNISTFLNLIDGIDSSATGGLLLIATTNHPEQLDPAINNRPGRFDVVIEIPSPEPSLRHQFFHSRLPSDTCPKLLTQLTTLTADLSFSHLQEILRLSGLLAIHSSRHPRSPEDLLQAAQTVHQSSQQASNGFPLKPSLPFGLSSLRSSPR